MANLRGNLSRDNYARLMSTRPYSRKLIDVVEQLKSSDVGFFDPIPNSVRNKINDKTRRLLTRSYTRPINSAFYNLSTNTRYSPESDSLQWYFQAMIDEDAFLPPRIKKVLKQTVKKTSIPISKGFIFHDPVKNGFNKLPSKLTNSEIEFLDELRRNVGGRRMRSNKNRVNIARAVRTPVP